MARPRKTSRTLASLQDCDDAMCALKIAVLSRGAAEAARDKAVAAITEKYDPEISAQVNLAKDLELQLKNYYMTHLAEVEKDGKKSVALAHGVMGRRKSPGKLQPLNKAWTWEAVLVKLREKYKDKFLRKHEPEPDKEAIKKAELSADDLEACGLKIEANEDFYAEPSRTATTGA